jgi:hypothetical protein
MRAIYAIAALWATLALIAPTVFETSFAGVSVTPEKTVPPGPGPTRSRQWGTADPASGQGGYPAASNR